MRRSNRHKLERIEQEDWYDVSAKDERRRKRQASRRRRQESRIKYEVTSPVVIGKNVVK